MSINEIEKFMYQIISGYIKISVEFDGKLTDFWISNPNNMDKYKANLIYNSTIKDAEILELSSEEQCLKILKQEKLWDDEKQKKIDNLTKDIDAFKMELYSNKLLPSKLPKIREYIKTAREMYDKLAMERHQLDHMCITTHASLAKTRYLIGKSLLREDCKTCVWNNDDFWEDTSDLLDMAIFEYSKLKPDEKIFRAVAKSDTWRSIWACRHSENGIFGKPATLLNDDQRVLTNWSRLYDNAQEDTEPPEDFVIEEDDMFDGWLLIKRKERTTKKVDIENEKIRNSGEIYHVNAEPGEVTGITAEDSRSINELNSEEDKKIKKIRMKTIAEKGTVLETEMPDTKIKIRKQRMEQGLM